LVVLAARSRVGIWKSRTAAVGEEEIDLLAALLCVWRSIISPVALFLAGVPEQEPELHRTRL
jgi:hypothetical protein